MTSEERFEHIERTLVEVVDIQREQADTQRRQAALMLEIAQKHADLAERHAELTERVDTVISVGERFLSRNNGSERKQ